MFEKILVPVDGSEHSDKALLYARGLAEKFESQIILVHVFSVPIPLDEVTEHAIGAKGIPPEFMEAKEKAEEDILKRAEAEVEKAQEGKKRIPIMAYLKEGNIVQEIISISEKEKADLIVMGARGISKLKEVLLGSVSDGVARNAHCPIMIIK